VKAEEHPTAARDRDVARGKGQIDRGLERVGPEQGNLAGGPVGEAVGGDAADLGGVGAAVAEMGAAVVAVAGAGGGLAAAPVGGVARAGDRVGLAGRAALGVAGRVAGRACGAGGGEGEGEEKGAGKGDSVHGDVTCTAAGLRGVDPLRAGPGPERAAGSI
jgi:hypothetical protein